MRIRNKTAMDRMDTENPDDVLADLERKYGSSPAPDSAYMRTKLNERIHTSIRLVQEVMLWVGEDHAPSSVIADWSQKERDAVIEYLATVHFVASDNPGKLPPRPKCLDSWKLGHNNPKQKS